jgi:hypothetical protein
MTQLLLIPDAQKPPKMHWFNVTKAPNIHSFINHAWCFDDENSAKYSDTELVKAWQYSNIARYMWNFNIEPAGYVFRRHHHIRHQIADDKTLTNLERAMKSRGLDKLFGLDISIPFRQDV